MSKRTSKTNKEILANGEFYHVYNRGTDKRDVFNDTYDVLRFLQSMNEFNTVKPIGSIYLNSFEKTKLRRPTSKLAVRSVSSFNQYILDRVGKCFLEVQNKDIILGQFKNKQDYADYAKETLSEILENKKNSKELQRMLIE